MDVIMYMFGRAWLAQSEHGTLDFVVLGSSPIWV